jgi:1,2-diacylglycerol 3-beta-galactosyltransferase
MLSHFLPGQEAGNVAFVVNNGFGEFARQPKVIAERVSGWLQDDALLEKMSISARAAAEPDATRLIAEDLIRLLDEKTA